MKELRRHSSILPVSNGDGKRLASNCEVLDPQWPMLQKWNKIFVITCVMAISVDTLFLYIPVIVRINKCLDMNGVLHITASVLRTFFDLFYIIRIIFQFRTGFIAPSSRVFGRGELIGDLVAIRKRYLSSYFIIDVVSIIPLPQVVALAIIPNLKDSVPLFAKDLLKYTVLILYVPRVIRFYPLLRVLRTYGKMRGTAWAGTAYFLFLYMLSSHVVGANWYLLSVESEVRCWSQELKNASIFHQSYLACGPSSIRNPKVLPLLNRTCSLIDPDQINDTNIFSS